MSKIIETLIGSIEEKKKWNAIQKRSKLLIHDYKVVYDGVQSYLMNFASTSSCGEIINILCEVLDMFEGAAAEKKNVLEVIGDDVMAFCDDLLAAITSQTWVDVIRTKKNAEIHKKLGR